MEPRVWDNKRTSRGAAWVRQREVQQYSSTVSVHSIKWEAGAIVWKLPAIMSYPSSCSCAYLNKRGKGLVGGGIKSAKSIATKKCSVSYPPILQSTYVPPPYTYLEQ